MTRAKWTFSFGVAAAVIAASGLMGCGNDTTPAPTPAAPSAPAAPAAPVAPATPTAETPPTPATPSAPAAPVIPTPPAAPTASPATPATPSATATAESQADTLIAQATQYVKDNKLDLADQAVTKLQGMKGSLPATYGPTIDNLKTMLDAAKAKNGVLPGGLKLPGQ